VLLAGCKVDTTVTITMREDGSGVVKVAAVLDATAVKSVESGGGKLEDRVRVADLAKSGWTVAPWVRAQDGSATLTLTKPFADPAQATAILHDVSGAVGPLRDMKAERSKGLLSTKYSVTGSIDLAKLGTGISADQQLVQSLTAQGVDVAALDKTLLAGASDAVSVQVIAELPDGTTVVHGRPGTVTPVDASSSVRDSLKTGLVVLAVVLLAVAVIVLLWPSRRRGHGPARHRPVSESGPAPDAPRAPRARRGTPPAS
jgi:hypothetical protein